MLGGLIRLITGERKEYIEIREYEPVFSDDEYCSDNTPELFPVFSDDFDDEDDSDDDYWIY